MRTWRAHCSKSGQSIALALLKPKVLTLDKQDKTCYDSIRTRESG